MQNSLLSGYSRARGDSIGLNDPVLRAALVDRLLVEVVTELRNRPNWLSVPLATLTLVLKGKPSRTEEAAETRPSWAESSEAGSDAAEGSHASDAAAGGEGSGADAGSSDSFAVAPPADEATAADSESVAAAPRGTSGAVAAAIANSDSDDAGAEDSAFDELGS